MSNFGETYVLSIVVTVVSTLIHITNVFALSVNSTFHVIHLNSNITYIPLHASRHLAHDDVS